MVRHAKQDPIDCAAELLHLGVAQRDIHWTPAGLEHRVMEQCWPMVYAGYQLPQKEQLRQRIPDALNRAYPLSPGSHDMPVTQTTSQTPLYLVTID